MDTTNFSTFDASKYLDSQEAIDDYLAIAQAEVSECAFWAV